MTMDKMNDKFWDAIAPDLRRDLHLRPFTKEEAERAYRDAPEADISEEEIERLVQHAKSDIPKEPSLDSPSDNEGSDQIARDVCEIHRNVDDVEDLEVEDELERQRREALEEEDDDDAETSNA